MKHLPSAPSASTDPIKVTGTITEARPSGPGRWTVTIQSRLGRLYSGPFPSSATGPIVGAEITLLIVPSVCVFTSAVELLDRPQEILSAAARAVRAGSSRG